MPDSGPFCSLNGAGTIRSEKIFRIPVRFSLRRGLIGRKEVAPCQSLRRSTAFILMMSTLSACPFSRCPACRRADERNILPRYARASRFRGACDIRVWLCQIAKNCFYTEQKRMGRIELLDDGKMEALPASAPSLEDQLTDRDDAARIRPRSTARRSRIRRSSSGGPSAV